MEFDVNVGKEGGGTAGSRKKKEGEWMKERRS